MESIHTLIDELALLIKDRPCYLEIEKQISLMENDNDVILLANAFSKAQMEYSDGLKHYDDDSEELKILYNNLLICKNNLDSHPIVLRYYELLSEVNEPLNYLQFNLLSLFKIRNKNGCM